MSKLKKAAAAKQVATEQSSTGEATEPAAKPTKTTGKKTKGKAEATKRPRAVDAVMPKAKAADNLVVFAFRLTPEERDVIHEAAGPSRASRFVRAVALAAARRDVGALQAILLETQEATTG